MTRAQSLELAAGIIAARVSDLPALIGLLETAGQTRLAAALRVKMGGAPARVVGAPRPDAEFWRAEARKVLG